MHDDTKALLGSTGSSDRLVTKEDADPATYLAGLAVRRNSAGALSLSSSDGQLIGVSLGISLSDTSKTAVCRSGNWVPLRIEEHSEDEDFSHVVVGALVTVSNSTGKASDVGTATGAKYLTGAMKGIDPITAAEVDIALIDMGGGL